MSNETSYDEMSLAELFAESDRIGDKYLSEAEIGDRDTKLAAAMASAAAANDAFDSTATLAAKVAKALK